VRWSAARRAVLGVAAVLTVAVLVALLLVWRAQPSAEAAPAVHRSLPAHAGGSTVTPTAATAAATAAVASAASGVVVHVVGAVHHPGLVRLPAGSRVVDAVRAAGGVTASARPASVNLARLLVDGEQLVVQRRGSTPLVAAPGPAGPVGSVGSTPAPSAPVDLNSATLASLDALPGIGPVLAQRILDWRTAHGRFSSVDELGEVSGIGEATLADLRPVVTV
jgi:competence protein ComEA